MTYANNFDKAMKRNFCIHVIIATFYLIAWLAKFHFIPGGDWLIRISTIAWCILFLHPLFVIKEKTLKQLYSVNSIGLVLALLGIMFKVSHVFAFQLYKDIPLDLFGFPAMLVALVYNFSQIDKICGLSWESKNLAAKLILFPWMMLLLSLIWYSLYSSMLAR